jgi:5-hydroxyisourate hydrolase
MAEGMTRISTHVLDTTLGGPAAGVPVRLERRDRTGEWLPLGSAQTGTDGRCKELLPESLLLSEGAYRLVFDVGTYYAGQHVAGFYPVVEITFEVRTGESRFHIPLLLSPNGYTTYRGN